MASMSRLLKTIVQGSITECSTNDSWLSEFWNIRLKEMSEILLAIAAEDGHQCGLSWKENERRRRRAHDLALPLLHSEGKQTPYSSFWIPRQICCGSMVARIILCVLLRSATPVRIRRVVLPRLEPCICDVR
jgi:hypothetical protein